MWVYQKQLTLESAHILGLYQNSIPCSPISASRVFLPRSPGLHKPLPAHGPFSPASVVQTWERGTHHLHAACTLQAPADKEADPAGAGGNQAAGEGQRRGSGVPPMAPSSLTHTTGRTRPPRNPGAPSAVNTQSPENIMESCQGPQPFK